jgi:hypothetical protein
MITCVEAYYGEDSAKGDRMPYYSLKIENTDKNLSTPAHDRADALRIFGKELGLMLSLEDSGVVSETYLMDEWWNDAPHWVNPTIPVYVAQK